MRKLEITSHSRCWCRNGSWNDCNGIYLGVILDVVMCDVTSPPFVTPLPFTCLTSCCRTSLDVYEIMSGFLSACKKEICDDIRTIGRLSHLIFFFYFVHNIVMYLGLCSCFPEIFLSLPLLLVPVSHLFLLLVFFPAPALILLHPSTILQWAVCGWLQDRDAGAGASVPGGAVGFGLCRCSSVLLCGAGVLLHALLPTLLQPLSPVAEALIFVHSWLVCGLELTLWAVEANQTRGLEFIT